MQFVFDEFTLKYLLEYNRGREQLKIEANAGCWTGIS